MQEVAEGGAVHGDDGMCLLDQADLLGERDAVEVCRGESPRAEHPAAFI